MFLVTRPTVPAIAQFVDSIWVYDEPLRPGLERVLPTGSLQLLVNLADDRLGQQGRSEVGGAALQGAHRGPVVIDTGQLLTIAGVSFRPGGAYPFFAAPPSAATGGLVGLDDLWGRDGAVLRERLLSAPSPRAVLRALESALVERLAGPVVDPALAFAVRALGRGATVTAVTDRLGVGRRSFTTRFTERVGLTPKRFAMVRRLQRVLDSVGGTAEVDWAAVAAEHGYYDQPHLIHDFRELAGISPTGYRPRSAAERNHVPISPIAAADEPPRMAS